MTDVTCEGGTIASLSNKVDNTNGTFSYTATFTPTTAPQTTATATISVNDDSYFDIAGNLGKGSSNPLTLNVNTMQLSIVRAHNTGNGFIKVEYNGIVTVTGKPILNVWDSTGKTKLGSYQYYGQDKSTDHYATGQTLLFSGGIDLEDKMLSIDLNGGKITSTNTTTNSKGETIEAGTNAQLNPPTYWGRDGYGTPSVAGMRLTINGTDSHDLFEFNQGNNYDVITGAAKGGDTFQIRGGAALIGGTDASNPRFSTITNFAIGIDNLVFDSSKSVNSYIGGLNSGQNSAWKTMRILDGTSENQTLTSLTVGSITTLLASDKTSVDSYSSLTSKPTLANFEGKGATAFTFGSGDNKRTFVALDKDDINGFNHTKDSIVEITGYSGNLQDLAIWKTL